MAGYEIALQHHYDFIATVSYVFIIWWASSALMSVLVINAVLTHNARLAVMAPNQRKNLFLGGTAFLAGPVLFGVGAVLGVSILERETAALLALGGSEISAPKTYLLVKMAVAASTSCFVIVLGIWFMLWRPLLKRPAASA